jgi:MSHA biogenesis protein MshQ
VSGLTYGAAYRWYVNVTDGTYWTRKVFSFETGYPSHFNPFDFGWQYRKQITIDHTQVADDLSNFPILINVVDIDLLKAQIDGGDILFMNTTGAAVKWHHEIESFDGSTGTLVAWVNIPALSSSQDTSFYMYYGNPSCINQEYPEKTWDSNYELVYHMNEANLAKIIDSTFNKRNTTSRSTGSPSSVNGKSGKAIHFTSGNWYIFPCSDIFRGNSDYSVELWFNADSMSALAYLMILNQYAALNPLLLGWNTANNILRTAKRTDYSWSAPVQTTALSTNIWNSVSLTYSTVSGWNLYWNTSSTSNPSTSSLDSVSSNNGLGGMWDGTSTFIGTIDEVRISNIVRSAAWIQTSYATMNDPSLFVHIGQEEPGP